nr:xylulose kinase-1 [Tanacetum cinerariifolium]
MGKLILTRGIRASRELSIRRNKTMIGDDNRDDTNGMIKVLQPKTAKEVVARERERKARSTLLMALPEDHLAKLHKMADSKEMWEAIKSRFSGNDESKKMQKYLLKQQLEGFLCLPQKVYIKGTTASSSSNTQNVAFVFADNTSSTNDVSTAYSVSSPSVSKSHKEGSSSYTDEVIHSFFSNQSSAPQLDYDDLEQINDDDDMEEMDLKCRRRDGGYNGNKARKNGRRPAYHDDLKPLVTIDGEDIDWSRHVEEDTQNYAMMAYSFSNSGSDNEKLLAEALKEKEDLKTKFDNWQNSLKNFNRLLNTQMSANDKFELGYGDYRYGSILIYENEVLHSMFINKECDLEDTPVNDRYAKGMHVVPPPITGNYMPSGPDVEIVYSKFTYGPKQISIDESDAKTCKNASCESKSSVGTTISMPKPVENASKVVCEPKVRTDAPIIEKYELDSDDDSVSNVQENIEKPSFAFT